MLAETVHRLRRCDGEFMTGKKKDESIPELCITMKVSYEDCLYNIGKLFK